MSVSIRLRREGAKNRPYYKVVVADSHSPRDGKFIEMIGTYDPKVAGENSTIKIDRAEHWISRGAQASETVRSILKKNRERTASGVPNEPGDSEPASKPKAARAAKSAAPMPNEARSAPAEESAPTAEETSSPAESAAE
ncbi:MAG: 30S ribosomal protein S16 [Chthoniobacterales bacterium]|nr:30S ribosomal protein S16 [Chthoniobacterales bacterium]